MIELYRPQPIKGRQETLKHMFANTIEGDQDCFDIGSEKMRISPSAPHPRCVEIPWNWTARSWTARSSAARSCLRQRVEGLSSLEEAYGHVPDSRPQLYGAFCRKRHKVLIDEAQEEVSLRHQSRLLLCQHWEKPKTHLPYWRDERKTVSSAVRVWNDIFVRVQGFFENPAGTRKALYAT